MNADEFERTYLTPERLTVVKIRRREHPPDPAQPNESRCQWLHVTDTLPDGLYCWVCHIHWTNT